MSTLPAYDITGSEVVDIFDEQKLLEDIVELLSQFAAKEIDPDDLTLADQIKQQLESDPSFYEDLACTLYDDDDPDSSEITVNDILDAVAGASGDAVDASIAKKIEDVVKSMRAASIAANDNIPPIFEEAFGNATNVAKVFGRILTATSIAVSLKGIIDHDFAPTEVFKQYVTLFGATAVGILSASAAATLLAGAPVWVPILVAGTLATVATNVASEAITSAVKAAIDTGVAIGTFMADAVSVALSEVQEIIEKAGDLFGEVFQQVVAAAQDLIGDVEQTVTDLIANGMTVAEATAQAVRDIYNEGKQILEGLLEDAVLVGEMTAAAAQTILEQIEATFESILEQAVQLGLDIYDAAIQAGKTAAEALNDLANSVVQSLEELWDQAGEVFGQIGQAAIDFAEVAAQALDAALDALNDFIDDVAGSIGQGIEDLQDWFLEFWDATEEAENMGSPLIFDLDGDGVELTSLENSWVLWDIDGDGFAERTGWVKSDDGFLAIDLNGDGAVTNHTELFGSITEDGFSALSVYDTNLDGVIDSSDDQFDNLLIWTDLNQNGLSEESELTSLSDWNIVSIDLNASMPYEMYIEGHNISHISTYTVDDGVSGSATFDIVDAWFQYDNRNTEYIEDYTLDLDSLFVATVRGYGVLPDLHVAASLDNDSNNPNSLLNLIFGLQQQSALDIFSDDRSVMDQARDIMLRWAGADGIDPTSMGQWADAQELVFINALRGEQWLLFGSDPEPWANAAQGLQKAFEIAHYAITARLIAQSAGAELFNDNLFYNPATDEFVGFSSFNQDTLNSLVDKSLDGTQVHNKTEFWVQVVNVVDQVVGIANLDTTQFDILEDAIQLSDNTLTIIDLQDKLAKNIEDQLSWTPDGDYILGTSAVDTYEGTVGDDFYDGGSGDDVLNGGIGNDQLRGNADNDILDGQLGNDVLWGGHGDDTYKFFLGHGDDTIADDSGSDTILFGAGITVNDLSFIRVGAYDLMVQIDPAVGYGSITIENQMSLAYVETLEFDDGSTLDLTALDHTYIGTEGNDTIYGVRTGYGGSGVDTIYGEGGDDVIYAYGPTGGASTAQNTVYGGDGNDTIYAEHGGDFLSGDAGDDVINGGNGVDVLVGGTGDDTLKGNAGDDEYHFAYGDGNDLIQESSGNDKIVFAAGITLAMLDFTRLNNNDIMIEIDGGAGGSITINSQTYGTGYIVETLEFSDTSTFDLTTVDYTLNGTSAGEVLYGVNIGGGQQDTIYGHDGNDTIYGYRSSADTTQNYLYAGAGDDTVYGSHGVDVIEGNEGNDLLRGNQGDDLITGGAGNDTLEGNYGNESYFFNYGDGDDIINEYAGTDKIVFGAGITQAMISYTRININDLLIEIDGGAGGSIEINYQTYGAGYVVETLEFSDTSTVDLTALDLTMEGTSGNDTLYGVNVGGSGVDTIYGYDGNDIIYGYRSSADTHENYIYGGAGNDTVYAAHGVDYIEGGDGADTVFAYNGNDIVFGGAGDDILRGGNNDDTLYGEDGADTLLGENNDDILIGGLGADTLTGGGGYDTFTFLSGSSFDAVDTITDFSTTYDAIDISDILSGYDPLTDAITDFVQITDDGTDSTLYVDADGGADNFVAIALIANKTGLTDETALETAGNLIAA